MMMHRLLVGLTALVACGCSTDPRLNGGGASFVYPIMLHWSRVYDQEFNVQVDYQSTGSGNGVQQTIRGNIDFGCTDAYINDKLLEKARGEILHIPLVMGGVVPIYSVPEATQPLRFTGAILADMYLGKITRWNDPALQAINPETTLPDQSIVLARRSDSSGTSAIFTQFLAQVSPEWKESVGSGTSVKWPGMTVGQRGNEGVAGMVARSNYSLGYVELIYAVQNRLSYGAVETRDSAAQSRPLEHRVFLQANEETVAAAVEAVLPSIPIDLRFSLVNAPGAKSYPIAGTNWAVLYAERPSAEYSKELVEFLRWATAPQGDAQKAASEMGYVALPPALAQRVQKRLDLVQVSP